MKRLMIPLLLFFFISGCGTAKWLENPNAVKIGMTQQQVIHHWGHPHKINTTQTRYGSRQQWVYSSSSPYHYTAYYVYFENRRVTAIQR